MGRAPKGKDCLPIIHFQVGHVGFREGISWRKIWRELQAIHKHLGTSTGVSFRHLFSREHISWRQNLQLWSVLDSTHPKHLKPPFLTFMAVFRSHLFEFLLALWEQHGFPKIQLHIGQMIGNPAKNHYRSNTIKWGGRPPYLFTWDPPYQQLHLK